MLSMRDTARGIFEYALTESSISKAFARHVNCERGILRVREDLYDLNACARVFVVSIGKAGHTLVKALESQVGSRLEGIVATSVDPGAQVHGFRYFRGGHPTPNADSVRAAEAILKSLNAQTASSLVIFMLRGGGSAIAEKPIDDEISLEDLVATYRALVHSGAPIAEINAIRKHLSAVKGGRLAQAAYPAQQVSILISDVPDSTPDALASGPTMPDSTTAEECYAIAAKYSLIPPFAKSHAESDTHSMIGKLPSSVGELFAQHSLEETPKSDDPPFIRARWWTILSNAALLDAAQKEA